MRIKPVNHYTRVLLAVYHEPATGAELTHRIGIKAGDLSTLLQRGRQKGLIRCDGRHPVVWHIVPGVFEAYMMEKGAIQ